jgi:hypothetical protein
MLGSFGFTAATGLSHDPSTTHQPFEVASFSSTLRSRPTASMRVSRKNRKRPFVT